MLRELFNGIVYKCSRLPSWRDSRASDFIPSHRHFFLSRAKRGEVESKITPHQSPKSFIARVHGFAAEIKAPACEISPTKQDHIQKGSHSCSRNAALVIFYMNGLISYERTIDHQNTVTAANKKNNCQLTRAATLLYRKVYFLLRTILDFRRIKISFFVRNKEKRNGGLAIMDIGILNGFIPDVTSLQKVSC